MCNVFNSASAKQRIGERASYLTVRRSYCLGRYLIPLARVHVRGKGKERLVDTHADMLFVVVRSFHSSSNRLNGRAVGRYTRRTEAGKTYQNRTKKENLSRTGHSHSFIPRLIDFNIKLNYLNSLFFLWFYTGRLKYIRRAFNSFRRTKRIRRGQK